ncbi:MAG: hypothetical protein AB1716_20660 [Planctomycetota bacterium]
MAASATAAQHLACLICDTPNQPNQVLCKLCAAPLELTRRTQRQGRDPCIVSVLGDSNVGKTVYLGFLLDMLSQRTADFEALPLDSRSVNLPQTVISHMAWRMFPPKTPMEANQWNWACYEICRRGKRERHIDLVTPDLPGEAIAAEVASPSTFRIVPKLLGKAAGLLLLADAALAAHGSTEPDFFALKMLSYIDECAGGVRGRRITIPIAIVLTKADFVPECFDDPRQFARANLNRLWNMCERRCARVEFFASSVVGALGFATAAGDDSVRAVPLHTSLRGVLEPFEWIVDQL